MNGKYCCFIGRQKIDSSELCSLLLELNNQVRIAIQNGMDTFICGNC